MAGSQTFLRKAWPAGAFPLPAGGGTGNPRHSVASQSAARTVSVRLRLVMAYTTNGMAALGDPTRRAIFERLASGPLAVGEIANGLPVSRPAVSQHLKVLKDAGL